MIEVTIKFQEVTIGNGSKYLVSPPIAIPDGFDFATIENDNHFKDWINEEYENNLYDMTYIKAPSDEGKKNGASMLGRIQTRYGSDCEVKRVNDISWLGEF